MLFVISDSKSGPIMIQYKAGFGVKIIFSFLSLISLSHQDCSIKNSCLIFPHDLNSRISHFRVLQNILKKLIKKAKNIECSEMFECQCEQTPLLLHPAFRFTKSHCFIANKHHQCVSHSTCFSCFCSVFLSAANCTTFAWSLPYYSVDDNHSCAAYVKWVDPTKLVLTWYLQWK